MSFSDFKSHKPETQAIIDAHRNDFTYHTAKSYLEKKGGYKAYLRSLGGVFAKYADFTGKVSTCEQLSEIGDYVWGLYDLFGVDYSNGCNYVFRENRYKAYDGAKGAFYPQEKPVGRFAVNYAAFSFANKEDLPDVDTMLANAYEGGKYFAVTNCGQGVVQTLKKAGLCPASFPDPAEYPQYWKEHGYPYTLIKSTKDLRIGDVLYFFNKPIQNRATRDTLSNWEPGGFHTAIVGEMTSDGYVLYDSGHAYTYYGEFRNFRKFSDKPYQWAEDWIGIRFDFGLKEKKMDISKYNDAELARMVWDGTFGSGDARKKALGDRYDFVQHLVDLGKEKLQDILDQKTDAMKLVTLAKYCIGQDGTYPWKLSGYKDEWCSEFVWYCGKSLGFVTSRMPAADICSKAHSYYKVKGQLHKKHEYVPKPGDIAYFGSDGTQHTAIVEKLDGKTLTTIDGNQYRDSQTWKTSRVGRCTCDINGDWIWGFANPLNEAEEGNNLKFVAKSLGAFIRSKPVTGEKIGMVNKGESVEIIEFGSGFESDGYQWAKVRKGTVTGWSQLDMKCYMLKKG